MAFLEYDERIYPLRSGENRIGGRRASVEMPLPERSASELVIGVESVGSFAWSPTGGAHLNGRPLDGEAMALFHRDRLRVAGVELIYLERLETDPGAPGLAAETHPTAIADEPTLSEDVTVSMDASLGSRVASQLAASVMRDRRGRAGAGAIRRRSEGATLSPRTISDAHVPEAGPERAASSVPARPDVSSLEAPTVLEPAPERKPKARIVGVLRRLDDGPAYMIDGAGFRIGREKRCDLVIPDRSVSRLHAEISRVRGRYLLRDLGRSGTLVNGRAIREPHTLRAGDVIGIGDYRFAFSRRPDSAADLVRGGGITPIRAAMPEAPTVLPPRGGSRLLFWLTVLLAAGIAALMLLT